MIGRVKLVNFTCHQETEIIFPEGLTIFLGRNGSGKSSVIDAITYALYGEHSRGRNPNIVRRGSSGGGRVELEFDHGGSRYYVNRSFDSRGNLESAILRKDGRLLVAGERRREAVSKAVQEILGLSYDRMRTAVVIQQGELDRIISADPRELKELFDDLMGLNKMEKAYQNMLDVLKDFERRIIDETGRSPHEADKVGEELRQLEEEIRSAEREGESLREELERLKGEMERVRARLDELRRARELREDVKRRLLDLRNLLAEKVGELQEISDKGSEYLKIVGLRDEVERRVRRVEELDMEIQRLREAISSLEAKRGEVERRLEEIEKELAGVDVSKLRARTLEEIERDARRKAERLRDDAIELGRDLALIKRGVLRHDTLLRQQVDQDLEEVVGTVSEAYNSALAGYLIAQARERDRIRRELEDMESKLKSLNESLEAAIKEREELSKLEGVDISYLREEVKRALEGLEKMGGEDAVERAKSMFEDAKQRLDILDKVIREEVEPDESLIEDLSNLLGDKVGELISKLREEIGELRERKFDSKEFEELGGREKELIGAVSGLEAKLKALEDKVREGRKRVEELRKIREVLVKAREFYDLMERVRNELFYRDGRVLRSLRTWILGRVSDHARRYLDLLDVRIDDVRIEERSRRILFKCFARGREVDKDMLSGGEKVALALAIRLAIGDVLGAQRLGFFILDEPTVHLDSENRRRLVEVFTNLSRAVRQVIIITHDEEVFEGADAKIVKFERGLSPDSPTMVIYPDET